MAAEALTHGNIHPEGLHDGPSGPLWRRLLKLAAGVAIFLITMQVLLPGILDMKVLQPWKAFTERTNINIAAWYWTAVEETADAESTVRARRAHPDETAMQEPQAFFNKY